MVTLSFSDPSPPSKWVLNIWRVLKNPVNVVSRGFACKAGSMNSSRVGSQDSQVSKHPILKASAFRNLKSRGESESFQNWRRILKSVLMISRRNSQPRSRRDETSQIHFSEILLFKSLPHPPNRFLECICFVPSKEVGLRSHPQEAPASSLRCMFIILPQ